MVNFKLGSEMRKMQCSSYRERERTKKSDSPMLFELTAFKIHVLYSATISNVESVLYGDEERL